MELSGVPMASLSRWPACVGGPPFQLIAHMGPQLRRARWVPGTLPGRWGRATPL